MKVDKEGAAVLGDGRPPEDTFKINECSTLEGTYKMKKQINAIGVVMNAPIRAL